MDPQRARARLEEERDRRLRMRAGLVGEDGTMVGADMDELSRVDQHPGDLGTEVFEQEKNAALLETIDAELRAPGGPPAIDPERVAPPPEAQPDPSPSDPLGAAPSDEAAADRFPDPVPGTRLGPGAVAESTTGGGPTGGTAATETGAIEADTAPADPTRGASGGTQSDLGAERGPRAPEDPPLREDQDRHD